MNKSNMINGVQEYNPFCTGILGAFFILIGGGIIILVRFSYLSIADFERKAISVPGVVTKATVETREEHVPVGGGFGASTTHTASYYNSTVQFKTDKGETIQLQEPDLCDKNSFTSNEDGILDCNSKEISVLFDPDNPDRARVGVKYAFGPQLLHTFLIIFCGLPTILAGICMLKEACDSNSSNTA
jgi:hypothetical protein